MLRKNKINYEIIILSLILILYFLFKTYFWFYGYNQGKSGIFIHGDGYFDYAKCLVFSNCNFDHFRTMQFLYPLYLTPIFYFDLNISVYVFILHHILSSLTLIFIYLSGKILLNSKLGMLSALIYTFQFQISYWFNFTLSDIAFHTHLAIFMFFFILFLKFKLNYYIILCIFSSITLYFIRPEGLLVSFFCISYFIFSYLKNIIDQKNTYLVFTSIIFLIVFIISIFIYLNSDLKDKIMSNVHVGWGLYYGSLETKTNANEVNEMLWEMFDTCNKKSLDDPNGMNEWWWCSKIGLDRIKNDPLNYLYVVSKRIPSIFYPGFYRDGVSLKYILISSFFSTYIIIGFFCLLIFNKHNKIPVNLLLCVLPIYILVIFYMDEWDVRYQLSPQVILILVSSFGFLSLANKLKLNRK